MTDERFEKNCFPSLVLRRQSFHGRCGRWRGCVGNPQKLAWLRRRRSRDGILCWTVFVWYKRAGTFVRSRTKYRSVPQAATHIRKGR